jgi:hypothetical protein
LIWPYSFFAASLWPCLAVVPMATSPLESVVFIEVFTHEGDTAPTVREHTETVKVLEHLVELTIQEPKGVGDGQHWTILRRVRILEPVAVIDAARMLNEVRRDHPAPPGSIGQSTLCLAKADRPDHQSVARAVIAVFAPGPAIFLVGGDLNESGATLWKGPQRELVVMLAHSLDVLLGWANGVFCHVESQWHIIEAKKKEYSNRVRPSIEDLASDLDEHAEKACSALAAEKRESSEQSEGPIVSRVSRRIGRWFLGRAVDPLESPAFGAVENTRWCLSSKVDEASELRSDLGYSRANLSGYIALVGASAGVSTRLHDADLALELIRLDIISLEPKLKRAEWVLEQRRTGFQIRDQQRREQWDRLVKCIGFPVALVQILVGGIQICAGAFTLGEKIPELQPWRWIIVASGVVSAAFGLGLLAYVVWQGFGRESSSTRHE